MAPLPNPFEFTTPQVVETAAASSFARCDDAAANQFGVGPAMHALDVDEHRFVLDEQAFMDAIEPLPLFLQAPLDVIEILAGYGA